MSEPVPENTTKTVRAIISLLNPVPRVGTNPGLLFCGGEGVDNTHNT
jgi:hypothetical protein